MPKIRRFRKASALAGIALLVMLASGAVAVVQAARVGPTSAAGLRWLLFGAVVGLPVVFSLQAERRWAAFAPVPKPLSRSNVRAETGMREATAAFGPNALEVQSFLAALRLLTPTQLAVVDEAERARGVSLLGYFGLTKQDRAWRTWDRVAREHSRADAEDSALRALQQVLDHISAPGLLVPYVRADSEVAGSARELPLLRFARLALEGGITALVYRDVLPPEAFVRMYGSIELVLPAASLRADPGGSDIA